MYIPITTCATAVVGGAYWVYKRPTINNLSDIRRPYDAVILLKKCSDNCTSCDELNETLLKIMELNEPSDEQIQYIHSLYCHPTCAISDYSLTVIWALITWKYPTRVAKMSRI